MTQQVVRYSLAQRFIGMNFQDKIPSDVHWIHVEHKIRSHDATTRRQILRVNEKRLHLIHEKKKYKEEVHQGVRSSNNC